MHIASNAVVRTHLQPARRWARGSALEPVEGVAASGAASSLQGHTITMATHCTVVRNLSDGHILLGKPRKPRLLPSIILVVFRHQVRASCCNLTSKRTD